MVNHIRTLLFNENSTDNDPWVIDQSFHPVRLTGSAADFRNLVIPNDFTYDEKKSRVDLLMPFVLSPEMQTYFAMFDTRITVPEDNRQMRRSTVREFYDGLAEESSVFVQTSLESQASQLIFNHVNDVNVDIALDKLSDIAKYSFETVKRFSACLYGLIIKSEFARLHDIGRL